VQLRTDVSVAVTLTGRPTPELPLAARILEAQEIW
jgi:hypothetical protein